jgi:hypothetical protein
MGVSTSCGVMIGVPYEYLQEQLEALEDYTLDEMIDNGELYTGSIYYDSGRDDNIVGLFIKRTNGYVELEEDDLLDKSEKIVSELEAKFPTVEWKLYLTLDVT